MTEEFRKVSEKCRKEALSVASYFSAPDIVIDFLKTGNMATADAAASAAWEAAKAARGVTWNAAFAVYLACAMHEGNFNTVSDNLLSYVKRAHRDAELEAMDD